MSASEILTDRQLRDMPLRFVPNDDQRRCLTVLARWQAPHNMRHTITTRGIESCSTSGIRLAIHGELATYDGGDLTRLVVACHQWRVRLAVSGRSQHVLELLLHARTADGSMFERHPGPHQLSEAADLYRQGRYPRTSGDDDGTAP